MSGRRAEEPSVVLWSIGSEAYGNDIASRRCRAGWMNSSVPDH
jgi:beta-galactosidase/beta-glucuronidase